MKSAEDWRKSRCLGNNSEEGIKTIVQQIQLDAMKEGMRRAAELADNWKRTYTLGDCCDNAQHDACCGVRDAILSAAEQLTEKDL